MRRSLLVAAATLGGVAAAAGCVVPPVTPIGDPATAWAPEPTWDPSSNRITFGLHVYWFDTSTSTQTPMRDAAAYAKVTCDTATFYTESFTNHDGVATFSLGHCNGPDTATVTVYRIDGSAPVPLPAPYSLSLT